MGGLFNICLGSEKAKRRKDKDNVKSKENYIELTERIKEEYQDLHNYCINNAVKYNHNV